MNILRAFIKQLNSRVVEELLLDYYYENADAINSKYREEKRTSGFTTSYKLGFRVWDAAAKIMLKLA